MEKKKHLEKVESLFEKSPVVEYKSVKNIVGSNYAKLLIHNLLKEKKIYKIGKGVYTKHNENSLAVYSFKPSYLGLQSALSYYGLWEQETIPVVLTIKKIRTGLRDINGSNVLIRNIDKKFFFGYNYVKDGSFYYPYSDLEKTLIDLIMFNKKLDKELIKKFKKKIDINKLTKYLAMYNIKFREKVVKILNLEKSI